MTYRTGLNKHVKERGWLGCTHINGKVVASRLYGTWTAMRNRCRETREPIYNSYKKYGITVCDFWNNYSTFRIWAISSGYRKGLSIDRINNDGNYEPLNCRWADAAIQARNRRNNVLNTDMVREIRASTERARFFGNKYGLDACCISAVRQNQIWRNV